MRNDAGDGVREHADVAGTAIVHDLRAGLPAVQRRLHWRHKDAVVEHAPVEHRHSLDRDVVLAHLEGVHRTTGGRDTSRLVTSAVTAR